MTKPPSLSRTMYDIADLLRWNFISTVPTVRSIQRKYRFNKNIARVIQAAIEKNTEKYEDQAQLFSDALYATTVILLLADKLAADAHREWILSIRRAGGKFGDFPEMEAENEEKLLQFIQNLDLEAFYIAACETQRKSYRSPLTNKTIMCVAKGYLNVIKSIVNPMISKAATRRPIFDFQYEFGSGLHRSLQVAMTLNKNELGIILAKHLDNDWRAEWGNSYSRNPPVSEVIGVALIEKTLTFLPPLIEELSLHWIKNPKSRADVKHD